MIHSLFVLLLVTACSARWNDLEFYTLNGRVADPCHVGLSGSNSNCNQPGLADPSITIVVPSKASDSTITIPSFFFVGKGLDGITGFRLGSISGLGCDFTTLSKNFPTTITATGTFNNISIGSSSIDGIWNARDDEIAMISDPTLAYPICYTQSTTPALGLYYYSGFKLRIVRAVNTAAAITCDLRYKAEYSAGTAPVDAEFMAQRALETKVCQVGPNYQQCYNPTTDDCCGTVTSGTQSVYRIGAFKCCSGVHGLVATTAAGPGSICPCYSGSAVSDWCPSDEPSCCLQTKYPELNDDKVFATRPGQCYNANRHQCCDTGLRFDSGTAQCCAINGIQSIDVPCPCGTDTDCKGNWADPTDDADHVCCLQSNPYPLETVWTKNNGQSLCDKYNNYPSGSGPYAVQPCLGTCMSKKFQTCCNGKVCHSLLENCCNATCCNKYSGTCARGRKVGAMGNIYNPIGYGVLFEQCSVIEQMNTIKAFWIFVLPLELMFVSFFCLAICLAFAAKAKDTHQYSIIERIMIFIAILTVLFCVPTYFAPIYKYGVVVFIAALLAIVTSAARVKFLNVLCIVAHVIAIIYLFDFVHGNYYLELAEWRNFATGAVDPESSGILHNIKKMWPSYTLIQDLYDVAVNVQPGFNQARFTAAPNAPTYSNNLRKSWCTQYYNYFRFDLDVRDFERYDNPFVTSFGYCSRAWSLALYLFMAALMDFVILQLFLALIALVFRFLHPTYEAIATDVAEKQL